MGTKMIQNIDVVQFSVGNQDEFGNVALKIQQRVQLDRAFGPTKLRPGKQRKTKVDGGGIQGINRGVEIETGRRLVAQVKLFGPPDEDLSEVGVDSPVALMVGVGEVAVRDRAVDAHVVEFRLDYAQARLDFA
jgi:hypothetical protein